MRVEYFPGVDNQGSKIRDFACAVMLPDKYPGEKKWKWAMITHGRGERSDGRQSHLEQLAVKGFDWNVDGRADSFFVSEDMKKAIDLHETILVIPTYSNFFEPDIVNRIYKHMIDNYQVQSTFLFEGFSLGGQAVFKYISWSEENARRVHLAVPVAAPYGLNSASIAAKFGPVIHAFSNDKDDVVASSNTVKQVSDINGQGPAIRAQYTLFRIDGHGGDKEAMALTPPKAPGGQGVTDAAETIWQLNDAIVSGTRRQLKTGSVVINPVPAPAPAPLLVSDPVADFNLSNDQVITTGTFQLDASASKNASGSWDGYKWDVKPVEGGSWDMRPEGAYGGPLKKLIDIKKDGRYEIALTVKSNDGRTAKKIVHVVVKLAAAKTLVAAQGVVTLTYSDGSQEQGAATLSGGKWTIKNASGAIIS